MKKYETDNVLKILGLTLGEPFSQNSRSGVNFNLFSRFKNSKSSELVDVYDLDLTGLDKIYAAITNFSFNRKRWGQKLHLNPWSFDARSEAANKILSNHVINYDVIFQDSAMFISPDVKDIPFVSYHDSNVMLSSRGGFLAHDSHLKGKTLTEVINQEKKVYDNAGVIFTMSDWLKNSLINDFSIPENKIKTVYAGTNISLQEFEKGYDGKTILFIGKNFERKGGNVLLQAFKRVKKNIPGAKLIIVGPHLKIDVPGVEVFGAVYDKKILEELFRRASLFVLPSLFEPFGIVFAEAFAFKLPCIGTNICAMPEIIEDEKGGLLVKTNDVDELAGKIISLLKNVEMLKAMGDYGYNKVKTTLNWDVVVSKMIAECQKVL